MIGRTNYLEAWFVEPGKKTVDMVKLPPEVLGRLAKAGMGDISKLEGSDWFAVDRVAGIRSSGRVQFYGEAFYVDGLTEDELKDPKGPYKFKYGDFKNTLAWGLLSRALKTKDDYLFLVRLSRIPHSTIVFHDLYAEWHTLDGKGGKPVFKKNIEETGAFVISRRTPPVKPLPVRLAP